MTSMFHKVGLSKLEVSEWNEDQNNMQLEINKWAYANAMRMHWLLK